MHSTTLIINNQTKLMLVHWTSDGKWNTIFKRYGKRKVFARHWRSLTHILINSVDLCSGNLFVRGTKVGVSILKQGKSLTSTKC